MILNQSQEQTRVSQFSLSLCLNCSMIREFPIWSLPGPNPSPALPQPPSPQPQPSSTSGHRPQHISSLETERREFAGWPAGSSNSRVQDLQHNVIWSHLLLLFRASSLYSQVKWSNIFITEEEDTYNRGFNSDFIPK